MPFSAKLSAYRPSPSFSSHSAIGCIAALDRLYPFFFFGAQRSTMLSCLAPGGACEGSQKRRRSRHCLPYFYDGRFGIDLVAVLLSRLYRDAIHRVLFGLVRQRPLMAPT